MAIDLSRRIMIVNAMYYGTIQHLVPRAETDRILASLKGYPHNFAIPEQQAETPWGVMLTGLVSPLAVPCNKPPYGTLHAIDLTTRKLLWSRPFGMARDTGPRNTAPTSCSGSHACRLADRPIR